MSKAKFTYEIVKDDLIESPREEMDNLGEFFMAHGKYAFGDKDAPDPRDMKPDAFIARLPVFMYDHSGITISTSPFSCPWDSGQIGEIFLTKERASKEQRQLSPEQVEDVLQAEIEVLNQYVTGDVWCVLIYDEEGNTEESLGGIYGYEAAQAYAADMIETLQQSYPEQYELSLEEA